MNIKDKGKSKRDKAKSKAIIGIVLAAIMLASVFAGISASAVADDNSEGSEGTSVSVGAAVGSITVSLAVDSPTENIANVSTNFEEILRLKFDASGEAANITKLYITLEGTAPVAGITGVGVNASETTDFLTSAKFSAGKEATLTIPGGLAKAYPGTPKVLYVWVNITAGTGKFKLGDTIRLNLTLFNATSVSTGKELTKSGYPLTSYELASAGGLIAANGPNDIPAGTYVDAGVNDTGIVLMQLNFTATEETCEIDDVTLYENGTANGTTDFDAIYLVNDTNADGVYNSSEDSRVSNLATTPFSTDNGVVTLTITTTTASEYNVSVGGSLYWLVVVNTSSSFWSGETLAVNVSRFNATGAAGKGTDTSGTPVSSNAITGQARIMVTEGEHQPTYDYIIEGARENVENVQLNFTALYGKVNITHVTLEQQHATSLTNSSQYTYPKIYWDVDEDGNVTSVDTELNVSATCNFRVDNQSLQEFTFSGYTDGDTETTGRNVSIGLESVTNLSTPWYCNVSVNSTNTAGQNNRTYVNLTSDTAVGEYNDSLWNTTTFPANLTVDIVNATFVDSKNIDAIQFNFSNRYYNLTFGMFASSVHFYSDNATNATESAGRNVSIGMENLELVNNTHWSFNASVYVYNVTGGIYGPIWLNFSNATIWANGYYNDTLWPEAANNTVDIINVTNATGSSYNVTDIDFNLTTRSKLFKLGSFNSSAGDVYTDDDQVTNVSIGLENITNGTAPWYYNVSIYTHSNVTGNDEHTYLNITNTNIWAEGAYNDTLWLPAYNDTVDIMNVTLHDHLNVTGIAFNLTTRDHADTTNYTLFGAYNTSTNNPTTSYTYSDAVTNVSIGMVGRTVGDPWYYNVSVYSKNYNDATVQTYINISDTNIWANGTYNDTLWPAAKNDTVNIINVTEVAYYNVTDIAFNLTTRDKVTKFGTWNTSSSSYTDWWANTAEDYNVTVKLVSVNAPASWYYNVSVYSANTAGDTDHTYLNISSDSLSSAGAYNDTIWAVTHGANWTSNIINITRVDSGGVANVTFDIMAAHRVVNLSLDTKLTIGYENETVAAGKTSQSRYIIIAVNTTDEFKAGNITKALPMNSSYGNWSNYIAMDTNASVDRQVKQYTSPTISVVKDIGALSPADDMGITVPVISAIEGSNPATANVSIGKNLVPVLQLNLTWEVATISSAGITRTARINSITISANGTANESSNVTLCIVPDNNANGAVDTEENPIASGSYSTSNETIKLELNPTIDLQVSRTMDATVLSDYQNVLVCVNVSETAGFNVSDPDSNTLWFNMSNPTIDYIATETTFGAALINATRTSIIGTQLYSVGAIDAVRTAKTGDFTGNISAGVDRTNVSIMQINYTASNTEDMNITGLWLTWNGTAGDNASIKNVTLVWDEDKDGEFDSNETVLNKTSHSPVFTNDVVWLNMTTGGTNQNNLTLNASESQYMLVCINTDKNEFTAGTEIAVNISADPYVNYTVIGNSSGKTITDYSTTALSSARLTGYWTGSITVVGYNLTDTTWVEGAQTNFPVLALNFSAANETINISSITITASGSANEPGNVTAKLLVDEAPLGSYESANEMPIATAEFAENDGTVTLTPSPEIQVVAGSHKNVLVVANITANVKAGKNLTMSLKTPSSDYVAKSYYTDVVIEDPSGTVSDTTWSTGNITVAKGANTAEEGPVTAMSKNFVELLQLNFSASYEAVNITAINITWIGTANATNKTAQIGVVLDMDGDGVIDTYEPKLNSTDSTNFVNNTLKDILHCVNATMLVYNTTLANNYTDGVALLPEKTVNPDIYLEKCWNTTGQWYYNVSLNYTNQTDATVQTYLNLTNGTGVTNGVKFTKNNTEWNTTAWELLGKESIKDIINITYVKSNVSNISFNIVAPLRCLNASDDSYANAIIYVNTSGTFNVSDVLKINVTGYTAEGVSSTQTLTAYGVNVTSEKLTGTGNITVIDMNLPAAANILAGANTSVAVWQLNMSTNEENATLNNITLTFNGTANVTADIDAINLYYDENSNATVDGNDTKIATGTIDSTTKMVTLTPTTTYVNTTPAKSFLVTVNTTSEFKDNETIEFNITCTKKVNATGVNSSIVIARNFTAPLSSNTLTGYGSIDVYNMSQPSPTVYNDTAATNVEVLKLNFSAPIGAINITNITLTENGTATIKDPSRGIQNVSVWFNDVQYNNTEGWPTENGTLVLELNHSGLGLIVDGAANPVTIKVNTTTSIETNQTIRFKLNRSFGTGYNATCNASLQTPYSNETGEINNTITVQAKEVVTKIQLYEGWNLISLWLVPSNTSIEAVTSEIAGNYDSIWAYDGCDKDWDSYKSGWPSDLTTMTAGWGYWINVTTACNLSVDGTFLPSGANVTMPTYRVCEGWNLIGFHSENETVNASTYLSGVTWKEPMYKWNAQTKSYEYIRPSTTLVRGEGYWLIVTETEATIYPY